MHYDAPSKYGLSNNKVSNMMPIINFHVHSIRQLLLSKIQNAFVMMGKCGMSEEADFGGRLVTKNFMGRSHVKKHGCSFSQIGRSVC